MVGSRWARVALVIVGGALLLLGPSVSPALAEEPASDDDVEVLPSIQWYIVEPGDTLGALAGSFQLTLERLLWLNPDIANPDLIFPGQAINVEEQPAPPRPRAGSPTYTVVPGDTMSTVARAHGVSLAALVALNPRPDIDLIYPGEVFHIPV